MEFAEWLREQIKRRPDLNQARLAELLGVYASTVHYWIKGRSTPDKEHIPKLAEIFDVEASTIYGLIGLDVGQPYQFKILGPLYEALDKDIEAIEDPEDRQMAIDQLRDALNTWRHLLERLDQRRRRADKGGG